MSKQNNIMLKISLNENSKHKINPLSWKIPTAKELNMKNYISTFVISAFPGCGKTYCYNHYQNRYTMLDSDSSNFSWVKDQNGNNTKERNPDFPNNYIKHIKDNIGKVDIIFVSSHKNVREALAKNNINTIIVYPALEMKEEYIQRYEQRGNDQKFIDFISNNWNNFINEIDSEDYGFLKEKREYLDINYLEGLYDGAMGNLSEQWLN